MPALNKFLTGAIPTPRHILARSIPFTPVPRAIPPVFLAIPTQLSYWLNNQYGDCVTAEEAFHLAAMYAYGCGTAEIFCTDSEVLSWCRSHGFLNGANLTDVMDAMARAGLVVNGVTYDDGPYTSVDWTNYTVLSTAIAEGPVKLGVASSQLQGVPGIGGTNGWWATGFSHDNNEDHCISVCGYGTAQDLAAEFNKIQPSLNVAVPGNLSPSTQCLAIFTWHGVGIIDWISFQNITGEAWLRRPNIVGLTPTPVPTPTPTPVPTPTPEPTPSQHQPHRSQRQCLRPHQRLRQRLHHPRVGCKLLH